MAIAFSLVFVVCLLALVVSLGVAIFSKTRRKKYLKVSLAMCLIGAVSVVGAVLTIVDDSKNKKVADLGFDSIEQMEVAEEAGFDNKDEYLAYVKQEEERRAAEEAAKIAAAKDAERAVEEAIAAKEAGCRASAGCWGERHEVPATSDCDDEIERLANYDFEWTNSFGGRIFARVKWEDEEAGILNYFGDKIKLQNGFGAWQNHMYVCTFDTLNRRVISVNAEPGRL